MTEIEIVKSALLEVFDICQTCDGVGKVFENVGMCGGCEICGNREEKEVLCPDCTYFEGSDFTGSDNEDR